MEGFAITSRRFTNASRMPPETGGIVGSERYSSLRFIHDIWKKPDRGAADAAPVVAAGDKVRVCTLHSKARKEDMSLEAFEVAHNA